MSAATVLRAARELIAEPTSWKQGYSVENCCCVGDAIERAADVLIEDDLPALIIFCRVIGSDVQHEDDAADIIVAWNDDPQRTHAEVIATLAAAEELTQ